MNALQRHALFEKQIEAHELSEYAGPSLIYNLSEISSLTNLTRLRILARKSRGNPDCFRRSARYVKEAQIHGQKNTKEAAILMVDMLRAAAQFLIDGKRIIRQTSKASPTSSRSFVEMIKQSNTAQGSVEMMNRVIKPGFGVTIEIECFLREAGVSDAVDRLLKIPMVQVKEDGSLYAYRYKDTNYHGREIVVTAGRNNIFDKLKKVCDILRDFGYAQANEMCGLHVHLDCRNLAQDSAFNFASRLNKAMPWLSKLTPPDRRNNRFCRFEEKLDMHSSERYWAVNFQAYHRHKTVEIRQFHGSVRYQQIKQWVSLILFLADRRTNVTTLDAFFSSRAPTGLKNWVLAQYNTHNPSEKVKSDQVPKNMRVAARVLEESGIEIE